MSPWQSLFAMCDALRDDVRRTQPQRDEWLRELTAKIRAAFTPTHAETPPQSED